jgi:hypothetical protein
MSHDAPTETPSFYHDGGPNYEETDFFNAFLRVYRNHTLKNDAQGYKCEITAGAAHPDNRRVAWVEYRRKTVEHEGRPWLDVQYRLKIRADEHVVADWEIATYNPAFGCAIGFMAWCQDHIVVVYDEKHNCYVCALTDSEPVRLKCIAHQWMVQGDVIAFRQFNGDQVQRLSLPLLEALPPLNGADAEATGL